VSEYPDLPSARAIGAVALRLLSLLAERER
jgi:hypothetical protein